jgi:cold-inducible RNA-binding protein
MARTIFVANLPYTTDELELRSLFETVGGVESARIAYDRGTQRHRGFGFVVMRNDADHDRAIERFTGYRHQGRKLVVNEARPREASIRR